MPVTGAFNPMRRTRSVQAGAEVTVRTVRPSAEHAIGAPGGDHGLRAVDEGERLGHGEGDPEFARLAVSGFDEHTLPVPGHAQLVDVEVLEERRLQRRPIAGPRASDARAGVPDRLE